MNRTIWRVFVGSMLAASAVCQAGKSDSGRQVIALSSDWKFTKGAQTGAEDPRYNDSAWQTVRIPHDWAIAGPFNRQEASGGTGKLPWQGEGWYRRTFVLPASRNGSRVYLDFDGVMAFPKVYVNGRLAGEWDYGYTSFRVDATPFVTFGGRNVIAVHVDTRNQSSRWYPGAGIYRAVTMVLCNPVHVAHWGTRVTAPAIDSASAMVKVTSTVRNFSGRKRDIAVEVTLEAPGGAVAARGEKSAVVPADSFIDVEQVFTVRNPLLWDIENPRLYTARTSLRAGRAVIDTTSALFGIRTAAFAADDGFHLNGRRVQIHGVNLHHDHGAIGAVFNVRAMERQLQIMKDMGVNAVRTSHNPPAPGLLDLCDRMGFAVWDEAFDKWEGTAGRVEGTPPLEQYGEKQIRNLVLRDRNHPCVVVWSIGNEIRSRPEDKEGTSPECVKFMSDFVRKYDPARPVGMACDNPGAVDQPILDALDVAGWNYMGRYARFRQKYPTKPILYSESASAVSTRGFYQLPLPVDKTDYASAFSQVNSYDYNATPWSDIPDVEFEYMKRDRYVAGEFVWTGFDYLGEPTPFNNEARSSYFGIVDLCGIPKDRYYLYRSYWRPDATTVHILPHWNWPGRVGEKVPVFVYTNGDSAELFLNGTSLGGRAKGKPPSGPVNFALGRPARAGSEQSDQGNTVSRADDGDNATRWVASSAGAPQWWQVDLGVTRPVRYLLIEFERNPGAYSYEVKASTDSVRWETIVRHERDRSRHGSGPSLAAHETTVDARYLRVEFSEMRERAWAGIREFGAYAGKVESPYYSVTDTYRLRWMDVVYQPGELKAVAYQRGRKIGEETMRTAGAPALIRLTPDRTGIAADGDDLCYVLVEALDTNRTLCPLADNAVHFQIEGPAHIAGVDNGNPLSYEPFQADVVKLFYGKAMLILRSQEGSGGPVRIVAKGDGLRTAESRITCNPVHPLPEK